MEILEFQNTEETRSTLDRIGVRYRGADKRCLLVPMETRRVALRHEAEDAIRGFKGWEDAVVSLRPEGPGGGMQLRVVREPGDADAVIVLIDPSGPHRWVEFDHNGQPGQGRPVQEVEEVADMIRDEMSRGDLGDYVVPRRIPVALRRQAMARTRFTERLLGGGRYQVVCALNGAPLIFTARNGETMTGEPGFNTNRVALVIGDPRGDVEIVYTQATVDEEGVARVVTLPDSRPWTGYIRKVPVRFAQAAQAAVDAARKLRSGQEISPPVWARGC